MLHDWGKQSLEVRMSDDHKEARDQKRETARNLVIEAGTCNEGASGRRCLIGLLPNSSMDRPAVIQT